MKRWWGEKRRKEVALIGDATERALNQPNTYLVVQLMLLHLHPPEEGRGGETWILDMMMITMMMNDDNDDDDKR